MKPEHAQVMLAARELRLALGDTQGEVARFVRVTREHYNALERLNRPVVGRWALEGVKAYIARAEERLAARAAIEEKGK